MDLTPSGVTVTSVFGPHSDVKLSHEQMLDRLGHASFLYKVMAYVVMAYVPIVCTVMDRPGHELFLQAVFGILAIAALSFSAQN